MTCHSALLASSFSNRNHLDSNKSYSSCVVSNSSSPRLSGTLCNTDVVHQSVNRWSLKTMDHLIKLIADHQNELHGYRGVLNEDERLQLASKFHELEKKVTNQHNGAQHSKDPNPVQVHLVPMLRDRRRTVQEVSVSAPPQQDVAHDASCAHTQPVCSLGVPCFLSESHRASPSDASYGVAHGYGTSTTGDTFNDIKRNVVCGVNTKVLIAPRDLIVDVTRDPSNPSVSTCASPTHVAYDTPTLSKSAAFALSTPPNERGCSPSFQPYDAVRESQTPCYGSPPLSQRLSFVSPVQMNSSSTFPGGSTVMSTPCHTQGASVPPNQSEEGNCDQRPWMSFSLRAVKRRNISGMYPNSVESVMWRVSFRAMLWDTTDFVSDDHLQSMPLWWRDSEKTTVGYTSSLSDSFDEQIMSPDSKACRMLQHTLRGKWHAACPSVPPLTTGLTLSRKALTVRGQNGNNVNRKPPTFTNAASCSASTNTTMELRRTSTGKRKRKVAVSRSRAGETVNSQQEVMPYFSAYAVAHGQRCDVESPSRLSDIPLSQLPSASPTFYALPSTPHISQGGEESNDTLCLESNCPEQDPSECNLVRPCDFDNVKRKTGWHPYVWYLMCRRPELYKIGIRARLVARVAGWEWEDVQKEATVLQNFLRRITDFLYRYPVPKGVDKKEAKMYKRLAANSVRTPWQYVRTPAVMRALRLEMYD